jgi:hypothetical protein
MGLASFAFFAFFADHYSFYVISKALSSSVRRSNEIKICVYLRSPVDQKLLSNSVLSVVNISITNR